MRTELRSKQCILNYTKALYYENYDFNSSWVETPTVSRGYINGAVLFLCTTDDLAADEFKNGSAKKRINAKDDTLLEAFTDSFPTRNVCRPHYLYFQTVFLIPATLLESFIDILVTYPTRL